MAERNVMDVKYRPLKVEGTPPVVGVTDKVYRHYGEAAYLIAKAVQRRLYIHRDRLGEVFEVDRLHVALRVPEGYVVALREELMNREVR